jgi:hypothetical protein
MIAWLISSFALQQQTGVFALWVSLPLVLQKKPDAATNFLM